MIHTYESAGRGRRAPAVVIPAAAARRGYVISAREARRELRGVALRAGLALGIGATFMLGVAYLLARVLAA